MAESREELEGMLEKFLNKDMYVIIATPCVGPETQKNIHLHLDNQVKLEKQGVMFGAGPLYNEGDKLPSHGMFIVRADSFEEAKKIAVSDPFHQMGLREYTVQKWRMNEGSYTITVNYSDQSVKIA